MENSVIRHFQSIISAILTVPRSALICICSMEELIMGTMLFVTKYGMTKAGQRLRV